MSGASTTTSELGLCPASPGPAAPAEGILPPLSPGEAERGDLHARKAIKKGASSAAPSKSKSKRRNAKRRSPLSAPPAARDHHVVVKYGSLLLLVGQMVGLVLLMRYSRTHSPDGELYLASTAVFVMEVTKLFLCVSVIFFQSGRSPRALGEALRAHVWASPLEVLKLCVPSFCYTIQNNLLYLALTNLDAATYQVLYQLKILTTAIFSATMLRRRFSGTKWASLVVLTVGVAVVQVSGSGDSGGGASGDSDRNRLAGLAAVLCATCTSGFSGVYFERILKGAPDVSLWMRNVQMGMTSVLVALATVFLEDAGEVSRRGFFAGYSPTVAAVIAVQAVGGLIVAVVVKYADNVLKVFASSFSIVLSCVISAFAFDFRPNATFLAGALLVMLSTVMYSRPDGSRRGPARRASQPLPITHGGARKSSLVM